MLTWIVWAFLNIASAEVPVEDWPPLVGHEILLTNPAGKQIQGTLVSADGGAIVIRRTKDGKEFTIPKGEVASAIRLDDPAEAKVDVETPLEAIRETTADVVESAKESTSEAVREAVGAEPIPPEPPSDPTADDFEDDEVIEIEGLTDDPDAPVLERQILADEKTYAEGLAAGRRDAQGEKVVQPFLISGGVTCCATAAPCLVSPLFGTCIGLGGASAGPIYYAGVRPYTLKDDLNAQVADEPTEFAAGYVRGYTDELQRRETLMSAAGAGTGFLVGASIGLVGYVLVSGL